MGGRFVFLIFAAIHLAPEELGRYGLIAAGTLILTTIVGLELNPVLHRRMVQGTPEEAHDAAQAYTHLIFISMLASFVVAAAVCVWLGWPMRLILLVSMLSGLEYVSTESMRILIVYGRGGLSIANVFLRSGLWCLVLPMLTLVGVVPNAWSLEMVLAAWIACDLAAILLVLPVWQRIVPRPIAFGRWIPYLSVIVPSLAPWIAASLSWRFLESGGRFFLSGFVNDAASGRFTVLTMLASLGLVGFRGVVEPTYFRRLTEGNANAELRFVQLAFACLVGGGLTSFVAAEIYGSVTRFDLTTADRVSMILLIASYTCLGFSQIFHYRLYRLRADAAIFQTSTMSCLIMLAASLIFVPRWGILGAALATTLAASALILGKMRAARSALLAEASAVQDIVTNGQLP